MNSIHLPTNLSINKCCQLGQQQETYFLSTIFILFHTNILRINNSTYVNEKSMYHLLKKWQRRWRRWRPFQLPSNITNTILLKNSWKNSELPYTNIFSYETTLITIFKRRSIEICITSIANDIITEKYTLLILLDMSAVFDTLDHKLINTRLHQEGIRSVPH